MVLAGSGSTCLAPPLFAEEAALAGPLVVPFHTAPAEGLAEVPAVCTAEDTADGLALAAVVRRTAAGAPAAAAMVAAAVPVRRMAAGALDTGVGPGYSTAAAVVAGLATPG